MMMSPKGTQVSRFSLEERRNAFRKIRRQAGLSLAKMAEMAGLSESMLSKFETGSRDLSPAAYKRLEQTVVEILKGKIHHEQLEVLRSSAPAKKLSLSTLMSRSIPEAYRKIGARSPELTEAYREIGAQ